VISVATCVFMIQIVVEITGVASTDVKMTVCLQVLKD